MADTGFVVCGTGTSIAGPATQESSPAWGGPTNIQIEAETPTVLFADTDSHRRVARAVVTGEATDGRRLGRLRTAVVKTANDVAMLQAGLAGTREALAEAEQTAVEERRAERLESCRALAEQRVAIAAKQLKHVAALAQLTQESVALAGAFQQAWPGKRPPGAEKLRAEQHLHRIAQELRRAGVCAPNERLSHADAARLPALPDAEAEAHGIFFAQDGR